jgi:two-component system, NtrC family, response regulator AtoC
MNETISRILSEKNIAVCAFDKRFRIVEGAASACAVLQAWGVSADPRFDMMGLFPELIGCESTIVGITGGKSEPLRLEFVNRVNDLGQVIYLNLLIIPGDQCGQALTIIENVTELAKMRQQLNQQKYDLLLYKNDVKFKKRHLAESLLGDSPPIQAVRKLITQLSKVPMATVLLLGESGTGKSLLARVIHFSSMPSTAPFVEINCAALPENLIESELFGYEKGAFTHATTSRPGLLQAAENGTIFLDEIGEMPFNLQAKLLSVLETKKFRRLGSNRLIEVRARIIAATNRDLKKAVSEKRFRDDLFYRLNVVSITLPPLRSLGNDILIIAEHLLKCSNIEMKKSVEGFTSTARQLLQKHHWPGNVRELGNMIERAMIFSDSNIINENELVFFVPDVQAGSKKWTVPPEGIQIEEVEKQLIQSAMDTAGGNKSKAARLLGISRDTLRYRLEKYDTLIPVSPSASPATSSDEV